MIYAKISDLGGMHHRLGIRAAPMPIMQQVLSGCAVRVETTVTRVSVCQIHFEYGIYRVGRTRSRGEAGCGRQ